MNFFYRDVNRKLLKRMFLEGRGRYVGSPLYSAVVGTELALHRAADRMFGFPKKDQAYLNENLTAVIKTFERPDVLARLLRSIRRFFPGLPVMVVDDSKNPVQVDGVETIIMPFDSGISAGRNEALHRLSTPYFLLLDDDFIFCRKTDLVSALECLVSEPRIDIMGGTVVDLPFYRVPDYRKTALFPTPHQPLYPTGSTLAGLPVYDKVPNFFIARTDRVRKVLWDEKLKVAEHADFFTRARGVLATVYNEQMRCLHVRSWYDEHYRQFRYRADVWAYLKKKYYA